MIRKRRERVDISQALIQNDGSLYIFNGHASILDGIVDWNLVRTALRNVRCRDKSISSH